MVFKLPRPAKAAAETPAMEAEAPAMAEGAILPSGITVTELEDALGGMYTAPLLIDY